MFGMSLITNIEESREQVHHGRGFFLRYGKNLRKTNPADDNFYRFNNSFNFFLTSSNAKISEKPTQKTL